MKKEGIILEYDGYTGEIKDENGNVYLLMGKEVLDEDVNVGECVLFEPEVLQTSYDERLVARFVRKLNKVK